MLSTAVADTILGTLAGRDPIHGPRASRLGHLKNGRDEGGKTPENQQSHAAPAFIG